MRQKIYNFNPNIEMGNILYKKKIKKFIVTWLFLFFINFVTLFFTFTFAEKKVTKVLSIILIIALTLYLITCAWIFDFGAANKLRKANFKIKGIQNLQQGHTFYYLLKKVGITRILLNTSIVVMPLIFGLLCFV